MINNVEQYQKKNKLNFLSRKNNLPNYSFIQLSFINKWKLLIINFCFVLAICMFGFIFNFNEIAAIKDVEHSHFVFLKSSILFVIFFQFIFNALSIYYTKHLKYQMDWFNFFILVAMSLTFFILLIFYSFKISIFAHTDYDKSIGANYEQILLHNMRVIQLLFFSINISFFAIAFIYRLLNFNKYRSAFYRMLGILPAIVFIYISSFFYHFDLSKGFSLNDNLLFFIFLIMSFVFIIGGVVATYYLNISSVSTYNNFNRINYFQWMIWSFALLLGIAIKYVSDTNVEFFVKLIPSIVIIGWIFSLVSTLVMIGFVIWQLRSTFKINPLLNKVILKIYIFFNFTVDVILIYLMSKFGVNYEKQNVFYAQELIIFTISCFLLFFLIAGAFNFITFEKWVPLSIFAYLITILIVLFLIMFISSLPDSKILHNFLGRSFWIIILFIYLIVEFLDLISAIFPIAFLTKNIKNDKNKTKVNEVLRNEK